MADAFDTSKAGFDIENSSQTNAKSPRAAKTGRLSSIKSRKGKNKKKSSSAEVDEFRFGNPIFEDEFQKSVRLHKQRCADNGLRWCSRVQSVLIAALFAKTKGQ